ncbi:MAG: SRPBCC family protein [Chthoniobacter sp.]
MLKYIILGLLLLVVVFVIVVATRPANFRVVRSATIAAPPAIVFDHVSNLHRFQEWSPFAGIDPAAKLTYAGAGVRAGRQFLLGGEREGRPGQHDLHGKPAE